jgi:hypothetical protein
LRPVCLGGSGSGQGWLPALLQDGLGDPFHPAVGLGATGADEAVRAPRVAIVCWKLAERNSWALSLITRSSCQPRAARSAATVPARALVQTAEGYAE